MAVREGSLVRGDGVVVCDRCAVAQDPWTRMRGLLGRRALDDGEGILLRPASSVHTLFMRFPIDVVFLDRELRVLRVARAVAPWRTVSKRGAASVLELGAGQTDRSGLSVGDRLELVTA